MLRAFLFFIEKLWINLREQIQLLLAKKFSFILFLIISYYTGFSQERKLSEVDSISYLIEKADDKSISTIERLSFAESARRLSERINNDTLKNQALRYIALNQFRLKNYNLLKKSKSGIFRAFHKN